MREIIFLSEDAAGRIGYGQYLMSKDPATLTNRERATLKKFQLRGITKPITNKYVTERGKAVADGTERRTAVADEVKAQNELNAIEKQNNANPNTPHDPIPVQNARKKLEDAQNRVGQLGRQGLKASLAAKKEWQRMNSTPQ